MLTKVEIALSSEIPHNTCPFMCCSYRLSTATVSCFALTVTLPSEDFCLEVSSWFHLGTSPHPPPVTGLYQRMSCKPLTISARACHPLAVAPVSTEREQKCNRSDVSVRPRAGQLIAGVTATLWKFGKHCLDITFNRNTWVFLTVGGRRCYDLVPPF